MLAKTDREIRLEEKLSKSLEIIDCFAMITPKIFGDHGTQICPLVEA